MGETYESIRGGTAVAAPTLLERRPLSDPEFDQVMNAFLEQGNFPQLIAHYRSSDTHSIPSAPLDVTEPLTHRSDADPLPWMPAEFTPRSRPMLPAQEAPRQMAHVEPIERPRRYTQAEIKQHRRKVISYIGGAVMSLVSIFGVPKIIHEPSAKAAVPAELVAANRLSDSVPFPTTTEAPTTTVAAPKPATKKPAAPKQTITVHVNASGNGVWDRVAQCESSGNWAANTGNGYYGGLQFTLQSWRTVGGTGRPDQASREEQIARAEKLKAIQGWGAWPACSRKLGLR